ncbi:MAG: hypothetical protein JXR84_18425 [Anaerolineae bacterium]|nr:hypothetical protein [Anaerolineae bacterium]
MASFENINKINEFGQALEALTAQIKAQDLELSELWQAVRKVRASIPRIRYLEDVDEGSDLNSQNPREKIGNWYGNAAAAVVAHDMHATAAGLLTEVWNELGMHQRDLFSRTGTPRHILRAGIGMYLGQTYLRSDPGAAMWWLLHAHADDLLTPHPEGGGAARDMLRLDFGIKEATLQYMERCAKMNLDSNEQHKLFAEHLVMQLSLEPEYSYLFSHPTSIVEFSIGSAYALTMIDVVNSSSAGEPMEELARYLMLLLAGWVPTKNVYFGRTRMDNDLIARYIQEPEAISIAHGRAILAECKNTTSSMSVAQVGYFLYRMHLTQVKVGILFAKSNVSGSKNRRKDGEESEKRYAQLLLDLAFQRDNVAAIVIDLKDIEAIANGEKTVWGLIDSRITERRFGKAKTTV